MVIEFSVKNFRSYRELSTISFEAEALKVKSQNIITTDVGELLPVVGVFGANASGKSNLISAIFYMWWAIQNTSFLASPTPKHPVLKPFLLNSLSAKEPSYFQVILWDKQRLAEYRYGFEITSEKIISEWLEVTSKVKKNLSSTLIFTREEQDFKIHKSAKKDLEPLIERVLPTALAISVFAQFAHDLSFRVATLMSNEYLFIVDSSRSVSDVIADAIRRCELDRDYRSQVLDLMKKADFGIQDLTVRENGGISTVHKIYDVPGEVVLFNMFEHESAGTRRFFELSAFILPVLKSGGVLVMDELGSVFHPFITKAVVNLFRNPKTNPHGAQLLFCSHEIYLLSKKTNLRRDQVWFTEKNSEEESVLRSLAEYKTRNDFEIAKNYLAGRFGAVPVTEFDEE